MANSSTLVIITSPRTIYIEGEANVDEDKLLESETPKKARRRSGAASPSSGGIRIIDPSSSPTPILPEEPIPNRCRTKVELNVERDLVKVLESRNLQNAPLLYDKHEQIVSVMVTLKEKEVDGLLKALVKVGIGKDFGSVSCVPVDFNRQEAQEQRLNEAKRQNTQSRLLGKRSLAAAVGRRATLPVVRRAHFLIVDQIVRAVSKNAVISFDFIMLIVIAALIAGIGLYENSPVIVVASMLISPMMCPVLAAVVGTMVGKRDLLYQGFKGSFIALLLCIGVGACEAAIMALFSERQLTLATLPYEITARGDPRGLRVGVAIAIVSGFGVALSLLGRNTNSLVGVAISASLLPPAVNSGMIFVYAFLGPKIEVSRKSMLAMSGYSLGLTLVNIALIYLSALLMFAIKRVAPLANKSRHWNLDFRRLNKEMERQSKEVAREDAEVVRNGDDDDNDQQEHQCEEYCIEMPSGDDWISAQRSNPPKIRHSHDSVLYRTTPGSDWIKRAQSCPGSTVVRTNSLDVPYLESISGPEGNGVLLTASGPTQTTAKPPATPSPHNQIILRAAQQRSGYASPPSESPWASARAGSPAENCVTSASVSPERTIQSGAFQSPKMSVTPSEPHSPDRVCAAIRFEEGSRFQSPQMSVTPREPHSPDGVFAAFRFEEGSREFEERSRETSSVISGSQVSLSRFQFQAPAGFEGSSCGYEHCGYEHTLSPHANSLSGINLFAIEVHSS